MTRNAFYKIILLFVFITSLLWGWMYLVRHLVPENPATITLEMYKGITLENNPLLEPWQRWDTPHYQAIAEKGYTSFANALFTPPLYPWLMGLTAPLFDNNTLASGLFISTLAFFVCLCAMYNTGLHELHNEKDAFRATLFLASFPTAFFLLAAYNESLFLLGAILSLLSTRRKKWIPAGLWGALAAAARLPGLFILVPLTFLAFQEWKQGRWRAWLAPLLASAGVFLFPLYVVLGLKISPLEIVAEVSSRGGYITLPGWNIIAAITRAISGQLTTENFFEVLFTLFFLVLTVVVWKKLPRVYGIYSGTMMLFFLSRFGSPQPLVGMARYVLEVFPAFLILAVLGKNKWVNRLIVILFWLGLLFFSAQFAIWGWVG